MLVQEIGCSLLDLLCHSRDESLRITCGAALTHFLRRAPHLRGAVLEKDGNGLRFLVDGLRHSTLQIQQVALNMLNLALWDTSGTSSSTREVVPAALRSFRKRLVRSGARSLVPGLLRIVDCATSPVVCGKAMLCLAQLTRLDRAHSVGRPLLLTCAERRLVPILDRVAGRRTELARNEYLAQSLRLLVEALAGAAQDIMSGVADEVDRAVASGFSIHADTLAAKAGPFPVLLALLSSTLFHDQVEGWGAGCFSVVATCGCADTLPLMFPGCD